MSMVLDHAHLGVYAIMEHFKDDLQWDFKAHKSFRVIIVGAGIAGLTAGIGRHVHFSLLWQILIECQVLGTLGMMWSSSSKFHI